MTATAPAIGRPTAWACSTFGHALLLALLLLWPLAAPVPITKPVTLMPLAFVSRPGGGGGGAIPGPPSPPQGPPAPAVAPAPPPKPEAVVKPVPVPKPAPVVAAKPKPRPMLEPSARPSAAPPTTAASGDGAAGSTGTAGGSGGGGAGTGNGTGGDGGSGARPAYGVNPKPPYPIAARRLGQQGVVLLQVRVRPDGSPADVRVQRSSGHELLDEAAASTVRTRWKFIPARRGDEPVESTVTFPIRFDLKAG
ncbi:MAG: energy transducer TonB [bacterium]|nr:energy transducer TonB [bacterium]